MITLAIIGFGSRGQMFANLAKQRNVSIIAIVDVSEACREKAKEYVETSRIYDSAEDFFKKGKMCDAIVISTQDAGHKEMALKALNLGYEILLEKPAACSIEDCLLIRDEANRLGRKVMLTHVMRYIPSFQYVKKLIIDGKLGKIVNIEQTENIAYWHFALSYVRGPWRNTEKSSPTVIAKCCHDLDIIKWLMDKKCIKVSSFGNLFYFNPENAPEGSAEYCVDCSPSVKCTCPYNSYLVYPERMKNPVVGGIARLKGKDVIKIIDNKEDIISKCVFHCDNNAVDNQVVNMLFADGSTANLTMIAYSNDCYRSFHIHGTKGDAVINGEDMKVKLSIYGEESKIIDLEKDPSWNPDVIPMNDGHGGGDYYLFSDFIDYITKNSPSITRTTIDDSIESHIMGFKAEESRLNGGIAIELT